MSMSRSACVLAVIAFVIMAMSVHFKVVTKMNVPMTFMPKDKEIMLLQFAAAHMF